MPAKKKRSKERIVAYVCATVITVAAFFFGHDGKLALLAVCGMLGLDTILGRRKK